MIRPVGGGKYVVVAHSGRHLSKPISHKAAKRRLAVVEYFKKLKKGQ